MNTQKAKTDSNSDTMNTCACQLKNSPELLPVVQVRNYKHSSTELRHWIILVLFIYLCKNTDCEDKVLFRTKHDIKSVLHLRGNVWICNGCIQMKCWSVRKHDSTLYNILSLTETTKIDRSFVHQEFPELEWCNACAQKESTSNFNKKRPFFQFKQIPLIFTHTSVI